MSTYALVYVYLDYFWIRLVESTLGHFHREYLNSVYRKSLQTLRNPKHLRSAEIITRFAIGCLTAAACGGKRNFAHCVLVCCLWWRLRLIAAIVRTSSVSDFQLEDFYHGYLCLNVDSTLRILLYNLQGMIPIIWLSKSDHHLTDDPTIIPVLAFLRDDITHSSVFLSLK